MNGKFLELLGMVEAGRSIEGKGSLHLPVEVSDEAILIDTEQSAHSSEGFCQLEALGLCTKCAELITRRIALRERLHSEGVDFPTEVFDST